MNGYDFVFHCTPEVPYTEMGVLEALVRAGFNKSIASVAVAHDFVGKNCENCGALEERVIIAPRWKSGFRN